MTFGISCLWLSTAQTLKDGVFNRFNPPFQKKKKDMLRNISVYFCWKPQSFKVYCLYIDKIKSWTKSVFKTTIQPLRSSLLLLSLTRKSDWAALKHEKSWTPAFTYVRRQVELAPHTVVYFLEYKMATLCGKFLHTAEHNTFIVQAIGERTKPPWFICSTPLSVLLKYWHKENRLFFCFLIHSFYHLSLFVICIYLITK